MKKLFTLLTLLLCAVVSVNATVYATYTVSLNDGATQTPSGSFFTVNSGGGYNTKYTGKYGGVTYTKGLKINSSSSISFTTSVKSNITIVQSTAANGAKKFKLGGQVVEHTASGAYITIGGTNVNYTMTENTTDTYKEFVFTDVPTTSGLAITNSDETGLLFVKVELTEDPDAFTQLTTPTITYNSTTGEVTITGDANATKVTYTTDGSTPTASSTEYDPANKPVVADGTTVKAIAIGSGSYTNSDIATETVYLTGFQVAAPVVNQLNGTVAIACATPDATIEYSTDGGSSWTAYSRAFTVTATTDLKARASRENCTTSDVTDATITAVSTNLKTRTLVMGYGAFNASGKVMTGKAGDDAEGFTLTMLTDQDKSWSNRNSITISEISNTRTTICGSNGVQVRVDMPAGIKATQLRLYSYVNSATSSTNSAWKEVNGEDLNSTLKTVPMGAFTDVADYQANPDVRIFPLDNVEGSFTFTNGGIQTCFVLVLDVIEPDVVITPANDMSTYVTANKLDFSKVSPAGLKAYVATNAASGSVTLEEVTTVPANTPLVLIGTAATDYTVPVAASASAPAKNLLLAGDGTTTFAGTTYDYILASDGKFHQISGGTVAVGKAYLHCDSDPTVSAPYLTLDFGGATGIADVRSKMEDVRSDFFDLQGRKVAQPTKGLYIVNGKKVIIK